MKFLPPKSSDKYLLEGLERKEGNLDGDRKMSDGAPRVYFGSENLEDTPLYNRWREYSSFGNLVLDFQV